MIDQKLTITITKIISITNSNHIFKSTENQLRDASKSTTAIEIINKLIHCRYSNQSDDGIQASGILVLSKSIQPVLSFGCWSVGSTCLTGLCREAFFCLWNAQFRETKQTGEISKWESGWRWILVFCVSLNARWHYVTVMFWNDWPYWQLTWYFIYCEVVN